MSQGVSLETIARQMERVLERIGAIDDKLAGLIGMVSRREAALTELAVEFRGLVAAVGRAADQP